MFFKKERKLGETELICQEKDLKEYDEFIFIHVPFEIQAVF